MKLSNARRSMVAVVAGTALLIPAGAVQSAPVRIRATDSRTWSPNFKHVEPGTKVVWKNPTSRRHTLTAWGGNWSKSAILAPGTSTSKTFRREGQFPFRCTIHSTLSNGECNGMCGLIHVENY